MYIKNDLVSITYHPETDNNSRPDIYLTDLTDVYNGQSGYTTKIRGLEKAWQFINQIMAKEELKDDLNFWDIVHILDDKFKLSVHTYCAVD